MKNPSTPPTDINQSAITAGAETWWLYGLNGEARWVGKAPGGDKLSPTWDSLGLLKKATDVAGGNITEHEFAYAPSGLRIRDKRTSNITPHDKRFAYTTTGTLLSVWEAAASHPHGDHGAATTFSVRSLAFLMTSSSFRKIGGLAIGSTG